MDDDRPSTAPQESGTGGAQTPRLSFLRVVGSMFLGMIAGTGSFMVVSMIAGVAFIGLWSTGIGQGAGIFAGVLMALVSGVYVGRGLVRIVGVGIVRNVAIFLGVLVGVFVGVKTCVAMEMHVIFAGSVGGALNAGVFIGLITLWLGGRSRD